MKLRPMLQVTDVEASSSWYQKALGLRSGHGGDEFEMLFDGDDFVLQLHRLDAHEHGMGSMGEPGGGGVSLWFECADRDAFEARYQTAAASGATVLAEPNWNPLAHHHEAVLTDHDGYTVVIHSPFDMSGP